MNQVEIETKAVIAQYANLLAIVGVPGARQPSKATMAVYVDRLKELVERLP